MTGRGLPAAVGATLPLPRVSKLASALRACAYWAYEARELCGGLSAALHAA